MKKMILAATIALFALSAGVLSAAEETPALASVGSIMSPAMPMQHGPLSEAKQGMEFVQVKGGCYCMGAASSKEGSVDAVPVHEVCVDDYSLSKYKVTQGQWRSIMGSNPPMENKCGDDCPVVGVSWEDAQKFIVRLNKLTGKSYRLPSEAEWEYAVRSGDSDLDVRTANVAFGGDAARALHPVGRSQPNSLGLYDMQGTLWEWTGDRYGKTYYSYSPKNNPEGPSEGLYRVLRGGSWVDTERLQQPAYRVRYEPWVMRSWIGFRLVEVDPLSAKKYPHDGFSAQTLAEGNGSCGIVQEAAVR